RIPRHGHDHPGPHSRFDEAGHESGTNRNHVAGSRLYPTVWIRQRFVDYKRFRRGDLSHHESEGSMMVCDDVNEVQWSNIPLLASQQGGVAASLKKCGVATLADAAGVVFRFFLNRKTTPSSLLAEASRQFINRSATPPCGHARRGISPHDKR